MTEGTPLTKITVRLKGPLLETLDSVADRKGLTLQDVVCEAIVRYLDEVRVSAEAGKSLDDPSQINTPCEEVKHEPNRSDRAESTQVTGSAT